MTWQPSLGQFVRYIGPDDGYGCKPGLVGVVTSLRDDLESYCPIEERQITVRLYNGWPASFAVSELEPAEKPPSEPCDDDTSHELDGHAYRLEDTGEVFCSGCARQRIIGDIANRFAFDLAEPHGYTQAERCTQCRLYHCGCSVE